MVIFSARAHHGVLGAMLDLRILNGVVVSDGAVRPLDIGIEGGKVVEIEESGASGRALAEIDATGLHVIPGAIDVHFHCRAPSRIQRGDFASETAAAAAGGVTTIFEMPISDPPCSTPAVFHHRRELATAQSHVNFALYSGAVLGSTGQVQEMAELGAIAFKLFMVAPTPGREHEFAGLWSTDEGEIFESLLAIRKTSLVCVIHAENDQLVRHFSADAPADGPPLRPPVIEATAIATVAALAREAMADIHIAHVSSRSALEAVRGARAMGASVTAETCPQYLLLDAEASRAYGAVAKIAPPLRAPEDTRALWQALADGTLNLLASDHSPFLVSEKCDAPYAEAPSGLPTVELLVPLVLDAAVNGRLPLELAVSLVTARPARRFGLYPRKGTLAVGADADIALVTLGQQFAPGPKTFRSRAAGCAIVFEGITLDARVESTIVNGNVVYGEGEIVGTGSGRFTFGLGARLTKV